jgi:hypothetical protein
MISRAFFLPAVFFLAYGAFGCGGAPKTDVGEHADPADLQRVPGSEVHREYRQIYSIEQRGSERARTPVGFLYHQTSEEDPEGKFFVRDRAHDTRGFILPSGRAYVFEGNDPGAIRTRDLGQTSLENGVKKILGVSGGIELEVIESAATRAANASKGS